jgi:acyl dehydratase
MSGSGDTDGSHPQASGAGELRIGQELKPFTDGPLTITDFVRYQGAANDMNPLHHDTEFAQAAGFPKPFAVGMLQAGILGTYVAERFGPSRIRRFRVQFREQAWPGDEITYAGKVVDVREDGGQRLADLELSATRQTGGVHLKGWVTVALPFWGAGQ